MMGQNFDDHTGLLQKSNNLLHSVCKKLNDISFENLS